MKNFFGGFAIMTMTTTTVDIKESTMNDKKPMQYQKDAIEALDTYFTFGKSEAQNGLLVMPTGSGKTFTLVNWLLDRAVSKGYCVLWMVHRQELVEQAKTTFREQSPLLKTHGMEKIKIIPVSGGHYNISQAVGGNIYVCNIASVANKHGMRHIPRMLKAGKEKLIVVIDEAHHAVMPSYRKVLEKITEINPNRILIGLTATPTRMQEDDRARLQKIFEINANRREGKGKRGFIHEVTLKELLKKNMLAKPIYKKLETQIDGDAEFLPTKEDKDYFDKFGELSEAIKDQLANSSRRNTIIVDEYLKNRTKYGKTLVFAVNQAHCKTLCKEFTKAGVRADYCISSEPDSRQAIKEFKESKLGKDELEVLINVQILTEGSDVPDIQTIFMTRQTNSDSLYMQMIGRGLRGVEAKGTEYLYIVDFHDMWEKFIVGLDPRGLFEDTNVPEDDSPKPPVKEPLILVPWALILRIYDTMKSNMLGLSHTEVYPHGWYAVTDEDGEDKNVLVFDSQRNGYQNIADNAQEIMDKEFSAQDCQEEYFDTETPPNIDDVRLVVNALKENGTMPDYYTFEQRDAIDARKIAAKIIEEDMRPSESDRHLEQVYQENPVSQQIYRTYSMFVDNVYDAIKTLKGGGEVRPKQEIISRDERGDYEIIPDYFDLPKLMDEVIKENAILSPAIVPIIRWTKKPLRLYFGLCRSFPDGRCDILINQLLSSSQTPVEVLKYLIYHELLHANGFWRHDDKFRSEEWKYPNSAEHDGYLDSLALNFNIEDKYGRSNSQAARTTNNDAPKEAFQESAGRGESAPSAESFGKPASVSQRADKELPKTEFREDIDEISEKYDALLSQTPGDSKINMNYLEEIVSAITAFGASFYSMDKATAKYVLDKYHTLMDRLDKKDRAYDFYAAFDCYLLGRYEEYMSLMGKYMERYFAENGSFDYEWSQRNIFDVIDFVNADDPKGDYDDLLYGLLRVVKKLSPGSALEKQLEVNLPDVDSAKLEEELLEILKIDGKWALADFYLGKIYFNKQFWEKAIAHYEKAFASEVVPKPCIDYFDLGFSYNETKKIPQAIAAYEKCLAIAPDYPMANNNIGHCYEHSGEDDKALEFYDKSIAAYEASRDGDAPLFYRNKFYLLSKMGKDKAALAFAEANPKYFKTKYFQQTLDRMRRKGEALK
ncbi:MAG: DEAD/DEAH box helicase family protein [Synergistaceae bacterium]|jgi:superfamily II DNA or RNA helicase|nr:DEAD/DEAH box helicase family protein [Synergistaceae bacterium]